MELELWLVGDDVLLGDTSAWSYRGRREVETVDGSPAAAVDAYRRALADLLDEVLASLAPLPPLSLPSG